MLALKERKQKNATRRTKEKRDVEGQLIGREPIDDRDEGEIYLRVSVLDQRNVPRLRLSNESSKLEGPLAHSRLGSVDLLRRDLTLSTRIPRRKGDSQ